MKFYIFLNEAVAVVRI